MVARKIKLDNNGIPNRVMVGVDGKTIPFPSSWYCGDPEGFNFTNSMRSHFELIKTALLRNEYTITLFGVAKVPTKKMNHTRREHELLQSNRVEFVLVAEQKCGTTFVWQKYESPAAGSGQNNIFAGGTFLKMSYFASIDENKQDEILEPVELRRFFRQQGLA